MAVPLAIGPFICGSETRAVDLCDGQCVEVDGWCAAQVDGAHRGGGGLAQRERLGAAGAAELMRDRVFVEMIVGDLVFAAVQRELVGGNEGEDQPLGMTMGAVAGHRFGGDVGGDGEGDSAAMAASGVGHGVVFCLISDCSFRLFWLTGKDLTLAV